MATQKYGVYIQDQIRAWPTGEPITTTAVAAALASAFSMDIVSARKITNVNVKRLADKGELARVHKGIYGKVRNTPFGKLAPSTDEMIAGLLLREGDKTIGFIAGPTLLNAIGLCSWIPREHHLVTNNYRRRLPPGTRIRINKPVVKVDDENVSCLQMLEAIITMGQYPVDAERPDEVLRGILIRQKINNEKLIWYARNYYGHKILLRTIDIALGGLEGLRIDVTQ